MLQNFLSDKFFRLAFFITPMLKRSRESRVWSLESAESLLTSDS